MNKIIFFRVSPKEPDSPDGGFKRKISENINLKTLTFKQNMEILNLLEAFDEDSDEDSQLDDAKNCK